jgi:hypothetical protein
MTKQQLKLIREASSKKRDSAEDFRNRMEQWLETLETSSFHGLIIPKDLYKESLKDMDFDIFSAFCESLFINPP